ncbi:MAG: hypothetical protein O2865_01240 [Planctomycetota bacterium]|nr:hypothetical protein [Planctomycetota bacterium]MDA0935299.1 hypothetical protein [Planctomycetota bacterium]
MNRFPRVFCLAVTSLLASGCAWTERSNRPVWNAFEEHLVPTSSPAFELALPLTAPGGLAAILIDIGIAHPIQVLDDAADDALDLWDSIEFEDRYYTEAGFLPFRAALTPVWFAGSFVGRSLFDWPDAETAAAHAAEAEVVAESGQRAWIARQILDAGPVREGVPEIPDGAEGDAVLRAMWRRQHEAASASDRLALVQALQFMGSVPEWSVLLSDPSAVVRHAALEGSPRSFVPAAELSRALLADPDEAVRELAERRFGGSR